MNTIDALLFDENFHINYSGEMSKMYKKNKETDKQYVADSLIEHVIPNICAKFQNPKSSSFCEIFDRKFCKRERKMDK